MLTDTTVRQARTKDKPYKLHDERGLYLLVNSSGRYWRYDYRFAGKRKTAALGVYPDVTLKKARERRDEARRQVADGIDPSHARKAAKLALSASVKDSFEIVSREWFAKFSPKWAVSHAGKVIKRLEQNAFPWIGGRPIGDIKAPEVLSLLRRVEARGKLETAHRTKQICGQVFRYAVATGRAERDPAADLRGALATPKERHHPSVQDSKAVGALLRAIEGYDGSAITRHALQVAPLTFVRPGELRGAKWSEFDFDRAEWRIAAERMKLRVQHIVPLSSQALTIFRELHRLTGSGTYVFPGVRGKHRPMSENTVNAALRRLGYSKDEMTGHGFRSIASTTLNEQGWNRDAIERQLAHAERNGVRAAYNYAEYLPERKRMMQAWADYLDGLKAGGEVVNLQRAA
jgi:integrase